MSPDSSISEPAQLPGTVYTTDSVPVGQRRAYWREALSLTFAATDMTVPDEACSGTIRTSPLGQLLVAAADGDPMRARRTPRLVAQSNDDHVVINLLGRGAARIEQDGREVYLCPGEITFCDMARPIQMEFPDPFQTKSLVLPRRLLGLKESDLQRITATPIRPDTPLGSLLSPFLTRLVDTAPMHPPYIGEALAHNVVDLLTVLADDRLHRETGDTPSATRVLLMRIKAFIDRHLADPDLTPEAVARANQISVRYLHKLFQTEDTTVSRWIQRRRLEECRRELARRQAANRTIAAVAHRWGFTSAAHFSRVFRAVYGISPVEWRNSAAHGTRALLLPASASRV